MHNLFYQGNVLLLRRSESKLCVRNWAVCLCFFFIIACVIKPTKTEVVIGEGMYIWGCNKNWGLGRDDLGDGVTADCSQPSTDQLPQAELLVNDDPLRNKLFKFVFPMELGSDWGGVVVGTRLGEIYAWGRLINIVPTELSPLSLPLHILNITNDLKDTQLNGHESVVTLIKNDGKVYAFGKDNEYGFYRSGMVIPQLIFENAEIFEASGTLVVFMTNDTEKMYSCGANTDRGLGVEGSGPLIHFQPKLINMTALAAEKGVKIKSIHQLGPVNLLLFENRRMYCWGKDHCQGDSVHQLIPLFYDFTGPLSEIPPDYDEIVQIGYRSAVFMLVRINGINKMFSYGNFWAHLRNAGTRDSKYPGLIEYGEIPATENITSFTVSSKSIVFLTDSGNIYAAGNNENFLFEDNVLWGENVGTIRHILKGKKNITAVRVSRSGSINIALFFSYKCFALFPSDPLVCNSRGVCLGEDTCDCTKSAYLGVNCEIPFECHGFYENDTQVCSGRSGICSKPEICLCDSWHLGERCEVPLCDGISNENKFVCSGNGECGHVPRSPNECHCQRKHYHGKLCNERISGARFVNSKTIIVDFRIPLNVVPVEMTQLFHCSLIITNSIYIFDNSSCFFDFQSDSTNSLVVSLGENDLSIKPYDTLLIRTVTRGEEIVEIVVNPIHWTVYLSQYWPLIVFGLLGILTVLAIVTCIVIFAIFSMRLRSSKREVEKFSAIEDIDILLEEAQLDNGHTPSFKVKKELFTIEWEKVKLVHQIATGGSEAVIYQGIYSGKFVAFKVFKTSSLISDEKNFMDFEKEVTLLGSLRHPNIVIFFGVSLKEPRVGIVTEFCSNGNLYTFVLGQRAQLKIREKTRLLLETCYGLEYLHSKEVLHRDIKPQNILVSDAETAKITDFGLSKIAPKGTSMTRKTGTSHYIAPEVVFSTLYSFPCDIFSLSMVIFELYTENFLPFGLSEGNIEIRIANDPDERPRIVQSEFEGVPSEIVEIMKIAWSHSPSARPSIQEIIQIVKENIQKPEEVNETVEKDVTEERVKELENNVEELKKENEALRERIKELSGED